MEDKARNTLHALAVNEAPGDGLDGLGRGVVASKALVSLTHGDLTLGAVEEVDDLDGKLLAVLVVLDLDPLAASALELVSGEEGRARDGDGERGGVLDKATSVVDVGPPVRGRNDRLGVGGRRGLGSVRGGDGGGSSLAPRNRRGGGGVRGLDRLGVGSSGSVGRGGLLSLLLLLLLVALLGGGTRAESPGDGEDTSVHVAVVQGREEAGRHVERAPRAARAKVGDLSSLGLAVTSVGDGDGLATVGSTSPLGSVHGDDEVRGRVGPATSTETSGVEGSLTAAGSLGEGSSGSAGDGESDSENVGSDHCDEGKGSSEGRSKMRWDRLLGGVDKFGSEGVGLYGVWRGGHGLRWFTL